MKTTVFRPAIAALLAFLLTYAPVTLADEVDTADDTGPVALSVAPTDHLEFAEDRPSWVDSAPVLEGEVHRWPVVSTPCRSEALSEEGLRVNLRAAVETYIETLTQSQESGAAVPMDDEWINKHRDAAKKYTGTVRRGDEVMYESATVLEFDRKDREWIESRWRRFQVGQRVAVLGIFSGGVVTLLVGIAAGLSVVTRRAEQRVSP